MKAVIALSSNFVSKYRDVGIHIISSEQVETGGFWAGFHVTLKIVCSGFLIGIQFSMGRGTLGITAFFMGTPGIPLYPPIGGGGGMGGAPVVRGQRERKLV